MVVKPVIIKKLRGEQQPPAPARDSARCSKKEVVVVPSHLGDVRHTEAVLCSSENEAVDVIDLGAPRRLRTAPPRTRAPTRRPHSAAPYTPNPRLYPGPPTRAQPASTADRKRRARRKRVFRRPVPNSRLYRPAPRRPAPPPPPLSPRTAWPPPPPRAVDTASRAAIRLLSARLASGAPPAAVTPVLGTAPDRRLIVKLPARGMDAVSRPPPSPDCSDGNEPSSAPSEFLAEFLSAIMRRQYAEALKYCRLILQYEPHNATARGFYPLLQHKLDTHLATKDETSSSEEVNVSPNLKNKGSEGRVPKKGGAGEPDKGSRSAETGEESEGEAWEESERSGASCSSLELDSSSRSLAPSASRSPPSTDGSWARCDSGTSRSDRDDNGNERAPVSPARLYGEGDVENDNAVGAGDAAAGAALNGSSTSSLQRLRAQFACSIK